MIVDRENTPSVNQSLVQAAGNYFSTDWLDLGTNPPTIMGNTPINDVGRAREIKVLSQLTADVTSGGAATMQVQLVQADDNVGTGAQIITQTDVVPLASLKKGYQFRIDAIPPGVTKRFLGFRYVIGTAAITAGTISSTFLLDKQLANFVG